MGVAVILGGTSAATAAPRTTQATPIIVGTKNFGEAYVLGQLYKQALEAKGFKVQYKENIGSTELIGKALTSGKITMYPEYIGVALTATFGKKTFPATAAATYDQVKKLYNAKGFTLTQDDAVPGRRRGRRAERDREEVRAQERRRPEEGPGADARRLPRVQVPARRGSLGMKRVYGVTDVKFTPLAGISAYKLLDDGKVHAAGVFSTDPPLATSKYVVLKDPKNIFGFQQVAPDRLEQADRRVRLEARRDAQRRQRQADAAGILAMNKAVYVDQKSPASIANTFLKANGLK